jgi:hypothetical protein
MKRLLFGGLVLLAMSLGARASVITLTFEGLGNFEAVGNYYIGGFGGSGSGPGPNYGVVFSPNALALIDKDAGGTGNFGGEPSPSTAMYFAQGAEAVMSVPAGFTTGFSFFYSSPFFSGWVTVYDGIGATGNVLATLTLPSTPFNGAPDPTGLYSPFVPIGVAFTGTAKSVAFGGVGGFIVFDDITFGSGTPTGVIPEPGTFALIAAGLASAGLLRRRRIS